MHGDDVSADMPTRNKQGRYIEEITPADVLRVIEAAEFPAVSARFVADQLDCTRQAADRKLRTLADQDRVERGHLSERTVIWWVTDDAALDSQDATSLPSQPHERAFEAFAEAVRNAVGEHIHKIILYGSVARGEATNDSDVDVLIVVDDFEAIDHLHDLAFDVGLDHGVVISPHIQTRDRFEARKDSPFLQNVLAEGRLYG